MFFRIDPSNGLPIYEQIVRQMKFAIAYDALKPRDLVPSVREMAQELTINPNTVARAYRELQSQGIVSTVRGTGLEVTGEAPKKCRTERATLIGDRLASVLREAAQSGLPPSEIRTIFETQLSQLASDASRKETP